MIGAWLCRLGFHSWTQWGEDGFPQGEPAIGQHRYHQRCERHCGVYRRGGDHRLVTEADIAAYPPPRMRMPAPRFGWYKDSTGQRFACRKGVAA